MKPPIIEEDTHSNAAPIGKGVSHRIKAFLGELPYTAELYWQIRQPGRPVSPRFDLHRLKKHLPEWRSVAMQAQSVADDQIAARGKRVLLFATQRYWIEHVTLLGMALSGKGHQVQLAYTPYAEWQKPLNRFDVRRQNLYALDVLRLAEPVLHIVPLLGRHEGLTRGSVPTGPVGRGGRDIPEGERHVVLPDELDQAIQANALRDTQYTLQVEQVNLDSDLYRMRLARDREAAQSILVKMKQLQSEVIVIPNGTILEFGAVYQTARFLNIPVVTYEFGEQRQRIWLAQNEEVMRQNTGDLWAARRAQPLNDGQWEQIRTLFASRQRASLWHNFSRAWQGTPSEGGEKVRADLGLDRGGPNCRPVVLLATNVIGDSLTLGRQVFSDSMTEWLERTVQYFASRPDIQFVIRIHPGEAITKGPSVAEVVKRTLSGASPEMPENIHLIPADAKVNSYDLFEIADLGLVYTTTAGLEMAMGGTPVIAVGNTHYRAKGFTLDPDTWEAYFSILEQVLAAPGEYRLTRAQVEQAWRYAYRFFFEFPLPFPWHVVRFWEDVQTWPLDRLLSAEGEALFGQTFRYLAGEPVKW
jgi:hypothetical protein